MATGVTIIEQGDPSFHTTARIISYLRPVPHEEVTLQSNMKPHDMGTVRGNTEQKLPSTAFMNLGPKTPLNLTSDTMEDSAAINPSPSEGAKIATNSSPHLGSKTTGVTTLARTWAATSQEKETQDALPTERRTVVIPKHKHPRKGHTPKVLILWQSVTIPCHFSDWPTPVILLDYIGKSQWAIFDDLSKAILTPPNQQSGTLLLEVPLTLQGIGSGETLTMLVRHSRVHYPHNIQHYVAYQAEDVTQHFFTTFLETTTIPTLTECVMLHEGLPLDPISMFQDCNLLHKPTLYLRFQRGQEVAPNIQSENPKSTDNPSGGLSTSHTNNSLPTNNPQKPLEKSQNRGHTRCKMVMALSTTKRIHVEPGQLNPIPLLKWLYISTPTLEGAGLATQWNRGVSCNPVPGLFWDADKERIPQKFSQFHGEAAPKQWPPPQLRAPRKH